MKTVYLYKEYNEENSYGEEFIKVFEEKEDALEFWKSKVGQYFEDPFDPEDPDLVLDYFAELEYDKENGIARHVWEYSYWIVEPKEVYRKSKGDKRKGVKRND